MKRLTIERASKSCLVTSTMLLAAAIGHGALQARAASYDKPAERMWLDQGWSTDDRAFFYQVSQGTSTLPVPFPVFMALEQSQANDVKAALFSDPAYLQRFGFIPGVRGPHNPDGLSIGFARTIGTDPVTGAPMDAIGFTCAACHTGQINYRGTRIVIDGGAALIDFDGFRKALGAALGTTATSQLRFDRFADRVLGTRRTLETTQRLKTLLAETLAKAAQRRGVVPHKDGAIVEGFGRLDAMNRIGNEVFGMQLSDPVNLVPLTAPVAYPHLWDAAWFNWVQYNGSLRQPMVRNAGQAIGMRALVNYAGQGSGRFASTVPVDRIAAIETLLAGTVQPTASRRFTGLHAPAWPVVFPPIDQMKAARGKVLYELHCAVCHLPAPRSTAFWRSSAWLPRDRNGQRYLQVSLVPLARVGTDPAQTVDMHRRTVRVPLQLGLTGAKRLDGGTGVYPFASAFGQVTGKVVDRWYDTQRPHLSREQREHMNGLRPNQTREGVLIAGTVSPGYKARPLDGIWATPPFLHNGSVPTLYDLLSPYAERPKEFWLGDPSFDPVKVGYVGTIVPGAFKLVTTDPATGAPIRGNGNGGHLFETPATSGQARPGTLGPTLSPTERWALVEYLKTL